MFRVVDSSEINMKVTTTWICLDFPNYVKQHLNNFPFEFIFCGHKQPLFPPAYISLLDLFMIHRQMLRSSNFPEFER